MALKSITKNKPLLGGLAAASVALLALGAWLAFGFFGIQSAFIDNKVDEAGPVFTSGETAAPASDSADAEAAPEAPAAEATSSADEGAAAPAPDEAETEVAAIPAEATEAAEPEIITVASGTFSGTSRYNITGEAVVLTDGSEQRFLRFENFESSNGPDLKVYLRAENGDFVNLGDLKGNVGSQNYEIPPEVDLSVFNQVDIWCERFSVGFGGATLS